MKKVSSGVWETVIVSEVSLSGKHYKFKIHGKNGIHLKGDPYATYSKGGADGASVIFQSKSVSAEPIPVSELSAVPEHGTDIKDGQKCLEVYSVFHSYLWYLFDYLFLGYFR